MKLKLLLLITIISIFSIPTYASNSASFDITLTGPDQDLILSGEKSYSLNTAPIFHTKTTYGSGIRGLVQRFRSNLKITSDAPRSIKIIDSRSQVIFNSKITSNDIEIPTSVISPGFYTLQLSQDNKSISQNFSWGVLAINTNKMHYQPFEPIKLNYSVLDPSGNMICDANLTLTVTDQLGNKILTQSTQDNSIKPTSECNQKIVTTIGDYVSNFLSQATNGTYFLNLSATTIYGTFSITSQYIINDQFPISIERISPTRIYPPLNYPVTLNLKFKQNFTGTITDIIPASFKISDISSSGQVETIDNFKIIKWNISAAPNQTISLSYKFTSPEQSPDFYTFGPIETNGTVNQTDNHLWQLAIDSTGNTSYSFQRKTWHDGTRYWRSFNDTTNSRIVFEYSPDGTSWTENTNARISTNTSDFSIQANSSNAFVSYKTDAVTNEDNILIGSSMVGWWKLDEGTSNTCTGGVNDSCDSSSSGFDGAWNGNAKNVSSGKFGVGVSFDGSGDYINMGDVLTFTNTQPVTISTWFNISSFAARNFLVTRNSTDFFRQDYALSIGNSTTISYSYDDASVGPFFTNWTVPTLSTNTWYHLAVTLLTDGTVSMYLDGTAYSNQSGPHGNYTSTQFNLGRGWETGDAGPFLYLNGKLDDVRVYNRILSSNEISTLALPGYDIEARKATSYPGVGFGWDVENIVYNGSSSTNYFQYSTITQDSSNKIWVSSSSYDTSSPSYKQFAISSSNANDITSWGVGTSLDTSTNANRLGIIVPHTSGNVFATWIDGTSIESKNFSGGTWATSPTSVGTGVTGLSTSLSTLSDTLGNIHLVYIGVGGSAVYREYTSSWQTAVNLDTTAGNLYPSISLDIGTSDIYAFWIRSNHLYYKKSVSPYASGNWDVTATDWKTTGTNTNLTSNYSANSVIFAQWQDGTTITWDKISAAPTSTPTPTPTYPPGNFQFQGLQLQGIKLQ